MKILIISLPRTGSTNLFNYFQTFYNSNYNFFGEPFNKIKYPKKNYTISDFINLSNVVIKTNIYHISSEYQENINNPIDFYLNFSKHFEKVILLNRKNIQDIKESYSYVMNTTKLRKWHTPYTANKIQVHQKTSEYIDEMYNQMRTLSDKINIPITWYEDIYSGNQEIIQQSINQWDIDIEIYQFMKYMNPSKRYRRFEQIHII